MDVSVIIVNYRTPDLVIDCVNSIYEMTTGIDYEIIVVDNNSGDDSINVLNTKLSDKICLIEADTNLGFGKANNLGIQHSTGKYVFLLNSDTILINNAIKILYEYMELHAEVGVAGGNLYSKELKENASFCMKFDDIDSIRAQASWFRIFFDIIGRRFRQRFYSENKLRQYFYRDTFNHTNKPLEVAYIFGTDMMILRSLFNRIGGFDPDFFMYAEEEELSWRIHKEDFKIVCIPDAKIIHLDGGTFKKDESFNSRQFGMRLNGAMVYYTKRFGIVGADQFYHYKMLRLKRQQKLAKLLKRRMMLELSEIQMKCLQEQYQLFKKADE